MIPESISSIIEVCKLINHLAMKNSSVQKTFIKTSATVISMHAHCDHYYEKAEVDFSNANSELFGFKSIEEFNKNQKMALNAILGKPVRIAYQYSLDGKTYISENIGIVGSKRDIEIFNKLDIGNNISVKVNPEDHSESFMISNTSTDFKQEKIRLCMPSLKKITKSVVIAVVVIWVVLYQQ